MNTVDGNSDTLDAKQTIQNYFQIPGRGEWNDSSRQHQLCCVRKRSQTSLRSDISYFATSLKHSSSKRCSKSQRRETRFVSGSYLGSTIYQHAYQPQYVHFY